MHCYDNSIQCLLWWSLLFQHRTAMVCHVSSCFASVTNLVVCFLASFVTVTRVLVLLLLPEFITPLIRTPCCIPRVHWKKKETIINICMKFHAWMFVKQSHIVSIHGIQYSKKISNIKYLILLWSKKSYYKSYFYGLRTVNETHICSHTEEQAWMFFMLRGGNNMTNYFPLQLFQDIYIGITVLIKIYMDET